MEIESFYYTFRFHWLMTHTKPQLRGTASIQQCGPEPGK